MEVNDMVRRVVYSQMHWYFTFENFEVITGSSFTSTNELHSIGIKE